MLWGVSALVFCLLVAIKTYLCICMHLYINILVYKCICKRAGICCAIKRWIIKHLCISRILIQCIQILLLLLRSNFIAYFCSPYTFWYYLFFLDLDVRWHSGDRPLFSRWAHLQKKVSLQVEDWRQCPQEKLHQTGRSLARWLQEILLRENWIRFGSYYIFSFLCYLFHQFFSFCNSHQNFH